MSRLGPSSSMLRDNIGSLNLIDFKPSSSVFTWNNRWSGMEAILERLNRFLVSYFLIDIIWSTRSKILHWRLERL